jgi:aminoglycoside phosphotransferase family enzyme/predicted kinase
VEPDVLPADTSADVRQAQLVERLRARLAVGAAGGAEVIETHISRVILAGELAYKVKRPVNLGFLDFSTLARRRHFAKEEVRLNRRLAAPLYHGVVTITGSPAEPRIGGDGPALEYAVQMGRFPQRALLTRHPLTLEITDAIAERIAAFHAAAPAARDGELGTPAQVLAPMLENFAVIRDAVPSQTALRPRLAQLERWTRRRFAELTDVLEARRRAGYIRECHGDLHRGNIAVLDGEPLIFDCIEFSAPLRWIDTASELAFLLMDLEHAGDIGQARRLLNLYLLHTGDYGALAVLRFYLVYRALVRAKVTAIGAAQHHHGDASLAAAVRGYVRQALALSRGQAPRLVILCGLSGSGKTVLATALGERLPLIHLRSDVERKRLFGMAPLSRAAAAPGSGIYAPKAGERTYRRLEELAQHVIEAGYAVLVDATFLSARRREAFRSLAQRLACPFDILALDAPPEVLRRRVARRHAVGDDASDADLAVLAHQLATREPLSAAERGRAIFVDTRRAPTLDALVRELSG